jgi:hypothetical protein
MLTVITGLVLLLGVGTLAHKGDEFFAPKADHIEIAKADISKTDTSFNTYSPAPTQLQKPPSIHVITIPEVADTISDFKLVRSETSLPKAALDTKTHNINNEPIALDCDLALDAKPLRGARVLLEISAPCHKRETVLISHAGLRFNEIISDKGMISIIIPVLSDPATIEVSFAGGVSKSISTPAKDLSNYQRTGVAWSGQLDLQLHAHEISFNSARNSQITDLNNRSYKQSSMQGGGYITMLGNSAVKGGDFLQIYSIENPNDVFVDFKISIDNPNKHCGTTLPIKTVRYTAELNAQIADKNVLIRDCSAKSETIVLTNFLRNLKVAQRN